MVRGVFGDLEDVVGGDGPDIRVDAVTDGGADFASAMRRS